MSVILNEPYKSSSSSCGDEAFDWFENAPTDYRVTRRWKEVIENQYPITGDTRQLHFEIPASAHFINLSETQLQMSLSIYEANGDNLDPVGGDFRGVSLPEPCVIKKKYHYFDICIPSVSFVSL